MNGLKIFLYSAAIFTSSLCTLLLFRGYRRRRFRLLMWSSVCFAGLTINNVALFLDLVVFPEMDLRAIRVISALVGMLLLLYAFVWETDEIGKM